MVTYGPAGDRLRANRGATPRAQVLQLCDTGVPSDLIYRDVGISGATGTNSRKAWRALNSRLGPGDVLVVAAVDRIGRRWMDTVSTLRDLRSRQVRVRSSPRRNSIGHVISTPIRTRQRRSSGTS